MIDVLSSAEEALDLLNRLGAPNKLIRHLELVGEAGDELLSMLDEMRVQYDKLFVQIGIALHDAGKILHPEELHASGNMHEEAGEKLLLEHGVEEKLAQCCRSHSQYDNLNVSFEELLIALSDKLWKGKRESDLELRVIDETATRLDTDRWTLFGAMDTRFEDIAAKGDRRLSRSL